MSSRRPLGGEVSAKVPGQRRAPRRCAPLRLAAGEGKLRQGVRGGGWGEQGTARPLGVEPPQPAKGLMAERTGLGMALRPRRTERPKREGAFHACGLVVKHSTRAGKCK